MNQTGGVEHHLDNFPETIEVQKLGKLDEVAQTSLQSRTQPRWASLGMVESQDRKARMNAQGHNYQRPLYPIFAT